MSHTETLILLSLRRSIQDFITDLEEIERTTTVYLASNRIQRCEAVSLNRHGEVTELDISYENGLVTLDEYIIERVEKQMELDALEAVLFS